jgi:hypothetical protein
VWEGHLDPVSWESLRSVLPDSIRERGESLGLAGTVSVPSLRIEQSGERTEVSGTVALSGIAVRPRGQRLGVSDAGGRIRIDPGGLTAESLTGKLGEDAFTLSGRMEMGESPRARVSIETELSASTLGLLVPEPSALRVTGGSLALAVELRGSPGSRSVPEIWGDARIADLSGSWGELPVRDGEGRVRFSGRGAEILSSRLRVGRSDFVLTGSVDDVSRPQMRFSLESTHLDLDEILPPDRPGETSEEPGVMALPGSGTFHVETLIVRGVRAENVMGRAHLSLDGLELEDLRGSLYEGTVQGNLGLRPVSGGSRWRYEGEFRFTAVAARPLVTDWTGLGAMLEGDLSGRMALNGLSGAGWDVYRTMTLDGRVDLADGAFRNLPGLTALGETFRVEGASRDRWPFRTLALRLAMADGRVQVEDVHVVQTGVSWDLEGAIGLDGELGLRGTVRVEPDRVRLPASLAFLAPYLIEDDGLIPVDFVIGGLATAPEPKLDWEGLGRRATERARREEAKNLERKLEERVKDPDTLDKLKKILKGGGG